MYNSGFRKFYWAFLFILIDFRIQGFDILPDIIGYMLIYSGLYVFLGQNEFFKRARKIAFPMILISILYIYVRPGSNLTFGLETVIGIIGQILGLSLMYSLLMGIREMGEDSRKDQIVLEAESSWRLYLILTVVVLAQLLFMLAPVTYIYYLLILFFANIYVMVKIMKFMYNCSNEFRTL